MILLSNHTAKNSAFGEKFPRSSKEPSTIFQSSTLEDPTPYRDGVLGGLTDEPRSHKHTKRAIEEGCQPSLARLECMGLSNSIWVCGRSRILKMILSVPGLYYRLLVQIITAVSGLAIAVTVQLALKHHGLNCTGSLIYEFFPIKIQEKCLEI